MFLRSSHWRAVTACFTLTLLIAIAVSLVWAGSASAAPTLSVSKSSGSVLLGGQASTRITVTNTGTTRGFNLSVTDTFTSNPLRIDGKNKTVTYVSASSPDGALTPTSVTTDPSTNALTVRLDDIRDLMPTESTTITIVVSPTDTTWIVGNMMHDAAVAQVNTQADGGGTWIQGSDSTDSTILPIALLTKSANQSTADDQATGCGELIGGRWPYSYTLTVQNNYVNPTDNVVVTDVMPDGIEYLGMVSGPAPTTSSRNNVSGQWTLTWNVGTMAASATFTAQYNAGVRYDYFGTANGGTNRAYDNYSGTPPLGTPMANQTSLTNSATMTCTYQGTPYSDSKNATVLAAYATIHKSVSPGSARNGETVHFTLTYYASEYYNLSNFSIVDVIPDGLTYTNGTASPAFNTRQDDTPGAGQTTLTWSSLPSLSAGQQASITFDATVDNTWSAAPLTGHWIVAGDRMTNHVTMDCDWSDTRQSRTGHVTDLSSSTVVAVGPKPPITKEAALDNGGTPGTFSHAIKATVGDTVWFRVRVNTTDGSSPVVSNTQFGNMDIVDWIPQGTQFVAGSAAMTYSSPGTNYFLYDPPDHPVGKYSARYSNQPQQISSGSLNGVAWSLGDVAPGGWWQVVFKVVVQNGSDVKDNAVVYDYGKLSWEDSGQQQSSDRDIASITYAEPNLTAAKAVTTTPTHPGAGQDWGYKITLTNSGTAAARNVLVTDTLPTGMRNYDPTGGTVTVKKGSTTLTAGTDYTLSYDSGTGHFLIDFDNGTESPPVVGTIHTEIPAPPSTDNVVTIEYTARVDSSGVGAGRSLQNNSSTLYSAQNAGVVPNRDYGPVTANASITLPNITMAKSIVGSSTVPIGTGTGSQVTYRLTVTVPARNLATGAAGDNRLRDLIAQDGLEYVTGSTTLADDSGTPATAAKFSDGSTTMNPTINWTSPNPGATLTWNMATLIDNSTSDSPYVFHVDFKCTATGLITPVSQGGSAISPANWRFWPNTSGNPALNNTASDSGDFRWGDGSTTHATSSGSVTTTIQQPYLQVVKTNDKQGPPEVFVKAGDTVRYTNTITNLGKSTSYGNTFVETLPVGMRANTPTTVSVTLDGVPLSEGTGYSRTYAAGVLTYDFDGGTAHSNIAAGKVLVIVYDAKLDGNVGSGARLTNNVYVTYSSEDGTPPDGRSVTKNDDSSNKNKSSSYVDTPTSASIKNIVGPNPARIGDTVVYQMDMTVPSGTDLYNPNIVDVINQDGLEYVAGSSTLTDISGSPTVPASFSGSSDPTTNYTTPNPGATFTWSLGDTRNGGGSDYVFRLQFSCKVTGLITPVSQGGSPTDQSNWVWWWTNGGNPNADNTASDIGTLNWDDAPSSGTHHSVNTPSATQHVYQPNLNLTKSNNSGGTVLPGGAIGYTINMANTGLSASYANILVDTLPSYMRDASPAGTVAATLNGVPLTPGVNFTTSWNGTTGQLTVDFTAGSGGATNIPSGQTLVVTYTGTVNSQVGAGSTLRNVASVEFNSQSDGSGRHVPTNTDITQHNTKASTADIPPATITKTQNATGNQSAIGQPYTYTVNVNVPSHTSIYNSTVSDTVPDGLAVDGTSTYLDGVPQTIGTVTATPQGNGTTIVSWNIGDHTNNTASAQALGLHIDVHIKTAFNGGGQVLGLPPQSTFANTAGLGWDDASSSGTHHVGSATATSVTTTEPHLVMTKANDAPSPIPGGQTVHYTLTMQNTGTSTSYKNVLVDTLPAGMRGIPPTVTNVTLAGVSLTENTDYWLTWNSGTGDLTVDLDHSVSKTNIQTGVGNRLIVYVNATPSADAGAGATLTNTASIGYNSWSGSNGRATARTSNPADDNTKSSTVTIQQATFTKTQNAVANKSNIGEPFTYTLTVGVPAHSTIYNASVSDYTVDGLAVDATSTYVDGSPQAVGSVATTYHSGTGITDVIWTIGNYTNNTGATQQVQLHIDVHIKTAFHDSTPVRGLPTQSTFANTANAGYDDAASGGGHHTAAASATTVTATEPHLVLTKSNDATGPVVGGQPVHYTVNVTNTGTGTSFKNVLVDTLPVGMRGNTPSVTGVTLGGVLQAENVNYTVNWDSGTGALTVDLTAGSAGATNILTGAGNKIVVNITASSSDDAGSGGTLTNTASIAYNSSSGLNGRATARTSNPADDNTKTSSVTVQTGTFTKTQNAVANKSNIGDPFTYTLSVLVPAHTSVYNASVTDSTVDGLAVDTTSTYVDGVSQAVGSVATTYHSGTGITDVVWTIGNYTNSSGATQQVQLHIDAHIKTIFHDSTPVRGLPTQSTFANTANAGWDDAASGGGHHTASASATTVTATEPHLVLTKSNDETGPVVGGQPVHYTVNVTNTGTGTSYKNVLVDTLPAGMRGNTPSVTSVTLGGVLQAENVNYTVNWDSGTGALTVDLTAGSSGATNILTGAGNKLVVKITASASDEAGAGATLTNIASIAYNSSSGSNGRQTNRTVNPADDNTKTSSITTQSSSLFTKTQNAVANKSNIGEPFTYTLAVSVPAHSSIYNASATDTIVDGLAVDGTSTYVDGVPQAVGSVVVTPHGNGTTDVAWSFASYTNSSDGVVQVQLHIDVRIKTTFHDSTPVSGLPTQSTFANTANLGWDDAASGGGHHTASASATTVTATEPHLVLAKSNDASGPVVGGQPVHYSVTLTNTGTGTSYQNVLVDTLPAGMRGDTPIVTSVTVGGVTLVENVNYTVNWNPATGALTVDLTAGSAGATNILVGANNKIVVNYTASSSNDAGAGRALSNLASVGYNSSSGSNGRQTDRTTNPADDNTKTSSIVVQSATASKVSNATGNASSIGQPFTYTIGVSVPSRTSVYNASASDTVPDGLAVDATSTYVDGSPQTIGTVTVTPQGDGTTSIAWNIGNYTNITSATQQLQLHLDVHMKTTFHDGNPVQGLPPASTFANSANLGWDDAASGGTHHTSSGSATDVTATEPHLVMAKSNDASGPVVGNQAVHYTLTIQNTGTSAAYKNVLVDTLPAGMRGNTPTVTSVMLGGSFLTAGLNYSTGWDAGTGALTIDLTTGSAGASNIQPGSGNQLVVSYTASASQDAGAGATLTNLASIAYNSWSGSNGRQTDRTASPADDNTKTSSITVQSASMSKTQNAAGNNSNIGQPFTYTVSVAVPANTTIYNASATDTMVDGLAVDGTSTYVDGSPQVIGTVTATYNPVTGTTAVGWNIGDYTNTSGATRQVQLHIDVLIKTAFHDSTPVSGLPPQATFANSANLSWDDAATGGNHNTSSASATDVTATEPHLVTALANDAAGPVAGNQAVHYTMTVQNTGTGTSYQNVAVATLPAGMRGNTPSVTSVTLAGATLIAGQDYTVNWDPGTGALTIDLTAGSAGASNIQPGGGNQLVVSYTASASQDAGSGATLTSLASIAYNSWSGSNGRQTNRTANPADDNTKTSAITVQLATAAKTQNAPGGDAGIGYAFDYTVTATVPTRTTIYGAQATDTIPDGLSVTGVTTLVGSASSVANPDGTTSVTWSIGDYTNSTDSPANITLAIHVRVDKTYNGGSNVKSGDTFGNSASVTWNDAASGGGSHSAMGTAGDVTVREPVVTISKVVSDATPAAGDTVTYTVTVRNTGDWPAYNIVVQDAVNASLTYVPGSITGPGANASGNNLSWDFQAGIPGPLDGGQQEVLTYQATVNGGVAQGTTIANSAAIAAYYSLLQPNSNARQYDSVSGSRDITLRAPALAMSKTVVSGGNPDWGENVTYRLTVTNNGDATASHVGVRDTIPSPHFSYVTGSTSASWPGGSSLADPTGTSPDFTWNLNASLAAGQQLTLEFQMKVDQWAAYGTKTNTGTGFGKDGGGSNLPEASGSADITVKQHPAVDVTKTINGGGTYVPVSGQLTYTIQVTNQGNTRIPVVPVVDTYNHAYLQYVSSNQTPVPDPPVPPNVAWADISGGSGLNPQQSASVTVTYQALQAGSTPSTDDQAAVTTEDDQHNPVSGSDTNNQLVITSPGITITKTLNHQGGIIPAGGAASYTIHVGNNGDTAVNAPVHLTDTYNAAYLQYASATPPPSSAAAGTLTWNDVSAGAGIAVGASIDVTVNFTTLKAGSPPNTNDSASANATDAHGVPVSGQVTNSGLTVTNPKITVDKQVKAGQKSPIDVYQDVVFVITVTNSGNTAVTGHVPMTDTFNPVYMQFIGASVSPTSTSSGHVSWTDISGGSGLAVGAHKTVEVTFKVLKTGGSPNTTDTARVSGAVDENGDQVPTASGSASITTGKVLGAKHWFIAEGSTGGGFDTWILLQNPGTVKANAQITFATAAGPRTPIPITLEPQTRSTIRIQDYVPNDFHVSTFVDSDQPVVAERSMYWDKRFWGATSVPGNPQPYEMKAGNSNLGVALDQAGSAGGIGKTIWFPEGSTAPGFDTWVLVANPGTATAHVTVHLQTPKGEKYAGVVTVSGRSRQTIHVNALLPNEAEVSTELDSDVTIVGERSMYWDPNAQALQPYQMKGGHSSGGSAVLSKEWFCAEGSTGGGFMTRIPVENPNNSWAKVKATFMTSKGIAAEKQVNMPPKSRYTFKVDDYVPNTFGVSTKVTADKGVVVERSMYWDKRTASDIPHMLEGTSTTAVTRSGIKWTVPEGSTGGGFDTWILISNPNTTSTTANVTFMTASGPRPPVKVTLQPNSRYTIRISDYVPGDFHVSTLVEAKGTVVVERSMYWDKRVRAGIQPYEMMGGHSTTGLDP